MRLDLINFRKHEKLSIKFSSLTLLRGSSGQGKSTLFQAFYWALYGSLRCVYPLSQPKIQTKVIYSEDNLTITRSRNPKFLSLTKGGKVYKDVEAQGIIDEIFGQKQFWLATSYLLQGQDHPLLEKNNTSSLELLNFLAFSGEDPRLLIAKISARYKEEEGELITLKKKVEELHGELATKIEKFSPLCRRSKEELEELQRELEEKKKELPSLQKRALEEKEKEGLLGSLQSSLAELVKEISLLPKLEDIEGVKKKKKELEKERDLSVHYWKTFPAYTSLSKEIAILTQEGDCLEIKGDLYKISAYVERYTRELSAATKLSLPYQEKSLQEEKKKLEKEIARLVKVEEVNRLRQKIYQDLAKVLPSTQEKLSSALLQEEIFHLRQLVKQKEGLLCPHCEKKVSYWKGELLKREVEPLEAKEAEKKLEEKETLFRLAKKEEEKAEKRKSLQKELEKLGEEEKTDKLPLLRSRLSKLEKIEFLEKPPYTLNQIERGKRLKELRDKLPSLPAEQRKTKEIEKEITSLQTLLEKELLRQEKEKKKTKLEKELSSLHVEGLEKELLALTKRIGDLEEEISAANFHNQIYYEHGEFTKLEADYQKRYQRLLTLSKLKKNALRAERNHLENVVETCNFVLEKVTSMIFEEPICAKLQLEKQLKNGLSQHKVNFYLNYRGVEGEIDQLSGGERQRMSLALVLAFSQFSNSPLLLDECLAFLDADLQESSLEAIREFTSGKKVIYIGHNVVEGYFSSVVAL